MKLGAAYNNAVDLGANFTLKVGETSVDLTGKTVEGSADGQSYYEWKEVDLGSVNVAAGKSNLVLECIGSGANLDYIDLAFTAGEGGQGGEGGEGGQGGEGGEGGQGGGEQVAPETIVKSEQKDLSAAIYLEAEKATFGGPNVNNSNQYQRAPQVETKDGAHGGKSVGYMSKDATLTFEFDASADGKAEFIIIGSSANANWQVNPVVYSDQSLYTTTSMTLNEEAVSLANRGFLGSDGAAFVQANLGELDVKQGKNTIVITALAQSANFDAIALITDLQITLPVIPEYAVTGAAIALENNKPVLTVSGTSSDATAAMFNIDFQSATQPNPTYTLTPVVNLAADGAWSMKADLTAALNEESPMGIAYYYIHIFFNEAKADLRAPAGFAQSSAKVSGLNYILMNYNGTLLVNIEDANKPAQQVTAITISEENNKPVLTISGTSENATADMFNAGFTLPTGYWQTRVTVTPQVTLAQDGSWTIKIDLTDSQLVAGEYVVDFYFNGATNPSRFNPSNVSATGSVNYNDLTYAFGNLYNNLTVKISAPAA